MEELATYLAAWRRRAAAEDRLGRERALRARAMVADLVEALVERGARRVLLLGFQHMFRKLYMLNLRWARLRELLAGLGRAHALLADDLRRFVQALAVMRDALDASSGT
jgi:hypothetical protein